MVVCNTIINQGRVKIGLKLMSVGVEQQNVLMNLLRKISVVVMKFVQEEYVAVQVINRYQTIPEA
jgi:hypothetical protein